MRFSPQLAGSMPTPKMYPAQVPDGDAGVAQTIAHMKALVYYSRRSPEVRQAALEAVHGVERGMDEISAVLDWVKTNIEFRGEYGETLQEPAWTIRWRAGDCDDQSMLAAAMLNHLGFETRFRTIALSGSADELSHVYVEARDKRTGQWFPIDPTVARSWPGWEPDDVARGFNYAPMPANASPAMEGLAALAGTLGALFLFS